MVDITKSKTILLKSSTSLAVVIAKQHFLKVCLEHGVFPNGFNLKFSLQTGLPVVEAQNFDDQVNEALQDASFKLMDLTLKAENFKADMLLERIIELLNYLDVEDRRTFTDMALGKFKKILIMRTKIHIRKLKKLLPHKQPMILNLDDVVSNFENKIMTDEMIPVTEPSFDWFDNVEFPPLEISVRRDWTLDIEEYLPSVSIGNNQSTAARTNGGLGAHDPTLEEGLLTSSPCRSSVPLIIPHDVHDISEVVLETQPSLAVSSRREGSSSKSPIIIADYSTNNFKPLVLHDIEVSDAIISLLKKGPSFTPTPLNPPDLASVHDRIMDWKERVRWAYLFRSQQLSADPNAILESDPFIKPPWYTRTEKAAPKASEEIEIFLSSVEASLLSSQNFVKFPSNISAIESQAFKELRLLKNNGVSVFLQDKSSRFVVAKSDIIASKVDADMDDPNRYEKMDADDTGNILKQIESWYSKRKNCLSEVDEDISNWLINQDSKPGKLKVLVKTHKPGLPVREVFSVCSQPVENLSAFLQFCYLGPVVNSGVLKWRLQDTNDLVRFLHSVNDYFLENKITTEPSICTVDIKNMFPSIFKSLALPAIKARLVERGYKRSEVSAVLEALEIVRDGTRVQWGSSTIKQIDGCSLGPADSCDYCDISLDAFLQVVVPKIVEQLDMDLRFLKFFRDDGILIFFGNGKLILDMLDILNSERDELTFTTERCLCGDILGCCTSCNKAIPFLDCLISLYSVETEDGLIIPQIKTVTYSKSTDVHHYIEPSSCTPNLHWKSLSIIKGVAHRLRITNMLDEDLLSALNNFSGYLVASGYNKSTILQHFTEILGTSNRSLVFRSKIVDTSFKIALVMDMHPALPNVQKLFDRYYPVIQSCPFSSKILPRKSLISSSRKLPSLSAILAGNPFKIPPSVSCLKGFQQVSNCRCKICKEAFFTSMVYPQISKDRGYSLPAPINCSSVNVVYLIICSCGKYYVGRTDKPRGRWANHKSHVRTSYTSCNLAAHCVKYHNELVGEDKLYDLAEVRAAMKFTLLESLGPDADLQDLKKKEDIWRTRLESWAPIGLNVRED